MKEHPILTERQENHLRHMLGINTPQHRAPKPYRDYAAVVPGDPEWVELERLGMIQRYASRGSYDWYRTTADGRGAAIASHRRIRYSREKRRYLKFLDLSDCLPDLTFREFLTSPAFAAARCSA